MSEKRTSALKFFSFIKNYYDNEIFFSILRVRTLQNDTIRD